MEGGDPRQQESRRGSGSLVLMALALVIAVLLASLVNGDGDGAAEGGEAPEGARSAVTGGAAGEVALPPIAASPPAGELERRHIRRHLVRVEAHLRERAPTGLTEAQRRNRNRHLSVLREYTARGAFPRNLHHPGERVPYFVDDRGVHCAVAYLMRRDGRDDLVEEIAATRNNARIAELADDPRLRAWLDEAGLSEEEAARIQPAYCGMRADDPGIQWCPPEPTEPDESVGSGYAAASMATGALGGLSLGLTLGGQPGTTSRWVSGAGAVSGLTGIGLGVHGIADGGDARILGGLNAVLGLATTYVGLRSFLRAATAGVRVAEEPDESAGRDESPRFSVSPLLAPGGDAGRAGVLLRVRH